MQFVHTHPIYPNKLCLYGHGPPTNSRLVLPHCDAEEQVLNSSLHKVHNEENNTYNWFLCGKPMTVTKNNKKHEIIEIGDRSLFFEETTGNTYKIDSEKGPVKLLLLNSALHAEPKFLKGSSKSNTHSMHDINKLLINSISQGFQGIAHRISFEGKKSSDHDMICSDVVLIFNEDCLQSSKRCPYTEFCGTHPDMHIDKNDKHVLNLRNHALEYVKK
jgi:hypothetical protein